MNGGEALLVVRRSGSRLEVASSLKIICGSSSFGRAIAFQAIGGEFEPRLPLLIESFRTDVNDSKSRCSSVAEHFLGKEEVKGSIPFNGSSFDYARISLDVE